MLKKFLIEVIISIVGKQGEGLVELLDSKKHVNEFIIAKKLDFTINQTRNLLYKISDQGLVSSIRKKDKKKGWYTYFWKIEVLKSLEFLKGILLKNINQIDHQLKSRQEKQFYVCERCSIEITEENALLHDFICDECGEVYSLKDNTLVVRDLQRARSKLAKQLKLVKEEIQKEKERLDKIKIRELKKIEEEKAAVRKSKREATAKLKMKMAMEKPVAKKSVAKKKPAVKKKSVKKKVVKSSTKKKLSKKSVKKKVVKSSAKKKLSKKPVKKKVVKSSAKKKLSKKPVKKKVVKKKPTHRSVYPKTLNKGAKK